MRSGEARRGWRTAAAAGASLRASVWVIGHLELVVDFRADPVGEKTGGRRQHRCAREPLERFAQLVLQTRDLQRGIASGDDEQPHLVLYRLDGDRRRQFEAILAARGRAKRVEMFGVED